MSYSHFQAAIPTSLQTLLGFDMMTETERSEYLTSVESLIIEAAVLRYLPMKTADDQSVFMSWLQGHSTTPTFWSDVATAFPDFATLLQEEINRFLRLDPAQIRTQ